MFNVGDKVVYPMHGAGVIESIENKEVLGETQQYYILRLPIGDMKVMVPVSNVEDVGLRQIMSQQDIRKVLSILKDKAECSNVNWNRRYRANLEKIKSGDAYEVTEVVRNLIYRDREKGLSSVERKMLDNARQILISELVLVENIEEDKALSLINENLA